MREYNEHKETAVTPVTETQVFTDIYNSYHRKVHDTAYHICRCSHASEEITQEVFIKLWVKKEYIQEIKDLDSWLFMMARNLSIDHLRRRKLEQMVFTEYSFIRAKDMHVEECVTKEMHSVMMEAVEQLHPQQKRVYKLKRFYGWKREKIAEQLNISENTVKATMQKALCSVKKYVKERVD
jgi:RNA polymerase sigma-70 factor (ECF subfamily)